MYLQTDRVLLHLHLNMFFHLLQLLYQAVLNSRPSDYYSPPNYQSALWPPDPQHQPFHPRNTAKLHHEYFVLRPFHIQLPVFYSNTVQSCCLPLCTTSFQCFYPFNQLFKCTGFHIICFCLFLCDKSGIILQIRHFFRHILFQRIG